MKSHRNQKNQKICETTLPPKGCKPTNVGKLTYFGQHFHLSLVSGDKNPIMILSNTEETNNHVVFVDKYELREVADFILKYLGDE